MNSCASSPDLTLDQTEDKCIRLRRSSLIQMPSIDAEEDTNLESKQAMLFKDQYSKIKVIKLLDNKIYLCLETI